MELEVLINGIAEFLTNFISVIGGSEGILMAVLYGIGALIALPLVVGAIAIVLTVAICILGVALQLIILIVRLLIMVVILYATIVHSIEETIEHAYNKCHGIGFVIVTLFGVAGLGASIYAVVELWQTSILYGILAAILAPVAIAVSVWVGFAIYKIVGFILFPIYLLLLLPFRYKGVPRRPVVQPKETAVRREIRIHKNIV